MLDRLPYTGHLPDSFFALAPPDESPVLINALFQLEAPRHEFVLYTDHQLFRLMGIFPTNSEEAIFGFWETPNAVALNQEAFAQFDADARQRNRKTLVGPLNINTFHSYRLRISDTPSWGRFDREPANPPYYVDLLDTLGFVPKLFFESRLMQTDAIRQAYVNKAQLMAGLAQLPFEFIPLTPATWQEHESALFDLVQHVFGANPAYTPIPKAEFDLLYNRPFAERLCPHSSSLIRDPATGTLVALCFAAPNYQPLNLPPAVPPVYSRDFSRLTHKTLLVRSVGVHPAYRKQGLMSAIGAHAMLSFQDLYDDVIFCLMRSANFSTHFSNGFTYEAARYALFAKEVA